MTTGQCGGGQCHAQRHAGLGQQRDAQMVDNGLTLVGQSATCVGAEVLAGRAGNDVNYADNNRHRLHQYLQIQLRTGDHEEQHIQRHGPAIHTIHQFFGGITDVTEYRAGHHAHQQQAEAAMNRADGEFQRGKTDSQQYKCHGNGQALTAGVEELLHPVQQPAHQSAQRQAENDLHDGLHQHAQQAGLTGGEGSGNAKGHGEEHETHSVINGYHQHQQPGHRAISLVLTYHHQRGGRGSGGGNSTQHQCGGDGNDVGEAEVKSDQHDVY